VIPAPPLLAGDPSRLGRYTLLGRLGQGGMGVVYLGRDQGGPLVAIKVIRPELAANPDYLARFRREVELGRKVNGRFVAEVLDASFDSEWPFLVTAYIEGTTLQARVRERGPVPPSEVRQLAVGTAAALSAVHAAGLVHRDLKPGNVLLSAEGPRVIDFGVARAVRDRSGTSAVRPGTVEFMAPEQFDGAEAGAAADVFAWVAYWSTRAVAALPSATKPARVVWMGWSGGCTITSPTSGRWRARSVSWSRPPWPSCPLAARPPRRWWRACSPASPRPPTTRRRRMTARPPSSGCGAASARAPRSTATYAAGPRCRQPGSDCSSWWGSSLGPSRWLGGRRAGSPRTSARSCWWGSTARSPSPGCWAAAGR